MTEATHEMNRISRILTPRFSGLNTDIMQMTRMMALRYLGAHFTISVNGHHLLQANTSSDILHHCPVAPPYNSYVSRLLCNSFVVEAPSISNLPYGGGLGGLWHIAESVPRFEGAWVGCCSFFARCLKRQYPAAIPSRATTGTATPIPIFVPVVNSSSPFSLDAEEEADVGPAVAPVVLDLTDVVGSAVLAEVVELVALDTEGELVLSSVILNFSLYALGLVSPS